MPVAALRRDCDVEFIVAPNREEVLARYRQLRAINMRHNNNVLKFLSADAILHQARRLGLARGKTLILESREEMHFAFDLAIYTNPAGRTRAIDRYAQSIMSTPVSDETRVLEAMCNARFAIINVERRHDSAGLIVTDLIRGYEQWLVDEGLERSASNGSVLATRLVSLGDFAITAGVSVPLDAALLADVLLTYRFARKSPAQVVEDRRFAESIYRAALADGIADRVSFQDVGGEAK